ncbi:MAG: hypothetical protein ACK5L0_08715 [Candidatus Fimivivens sp.]
MESLLQRFAFSIDKDDLLSQNIFEMLTIKQHQVALEKKHDTVLDNDTIYDMTKNAYKGRLSASILPL